MALFPSHSVLGSVLYVSLHRYDRGTFFPMGDEGASSQIGRAEGTGFTVNVPWNGPRVGDADYLAAWHRLVLPIAYEVSLKLVYDTPVKVVAQACLLSMCV
jgi:histone deacetylase 6